MPCARAANRGLRGRLRGHSAAVALLTPVLFALGCASAPPAVPPARESVAPAAADKRDSWRLRVVDRGCVEQVTALAESRLEAYTGLPRCGRVDAEASLGSSGDEPSRFEQFGEYRAYRKGASGSVLVWLLGDDVRVIQVVSPKLSQPLDRVLGEPEARIPSRLSDEWEQWVYGRRGLAAHVKRGSGELVTLFAVRPTNVAAFVDTDVARVAKGEDPVEQLR